MREELTDPGTDTTTDPAKPVTTADKPSAPQGDSRLDALQSQMSEMARSVQSLTSSLAAAMEAPDPTPQPSAKPAPASKSEVDAFLDRLASQPRETIAEQAKEVAASVVREAMGPTLSRIFDFGGSLVLEQESSRVDGEFGAGTFQEIYAPQIQKDLANLRKVNPEAMANRETVRALVDRVTGQQFTALADRKGTHVKKQADRRAQELDEIVSHIPQGGKGGLRLRGRGPAGTDLPDDFDSFAREISAQTGEPMDRDTFAKLYAAGNTIDDYLKAVGEKE